MHHRLDRGAHELGRVVDDLVVHAFGHVLLDLRHRRAHVVGDLRCALEPGAWKIGDGHRRLVVEQRAQRVVGRAELDARDVAQPRDLAVGAGLDDDVAELLLVLQAALRVDRQLQVEARLTPGEAPTTPAAACTFCARIARDHVAGRKAALGDLLRIEPDAHRVVAARRTAAPGRRRRCAPAGP